MKKILLCVLIFSLVSINVFADDVETLTGDNVLTVDEAIQRAVEVSPLIDKENFTKDSNFETKEEIGEKIQFIPIAAEYYNGSNDAINIYKLFSSFDIALSVSKKMVNIQTEKEIYDVIDNYKKDFEARMQQRYDMKDYEYNQMLHKINLLKKGYGLIGEVEYDTSENVFEIARNNKKIGETNLKKAEDKLGADIGLADVATRELESKQLYDITQKIENEEIDSFLARATSSSPLVEVLEKSVDLKQLELDYNTFNDPANFKPTEAKEADVSAERKKVENVEDALENIVREAFYGAQTAQKSYDNILRKYDIDKNLYDVKKKQYELGMITKLELLEAEKALLEDELNIEKAKNAFDMAMILLEKPYIKIPM